VRGLPHVCEHKFLATTKRGRGSSEGVEDLISDSGNDHDNGEASFSKSHYLFTCSIDAA
jgi:predicted Zn-dependent peptidase